MLDKEYIKSEFIKATFKVEKKQHAPEICVVLNNMPTDLLKKHGETIIYTLDAIMDDLYKKGELSCPGHRWLSGPLPASIRGHLIHLFEEGLIFQDKETYFWNFKEVTTYFYIESETRKKEKLKVMKGAYEMFLNKYGPESPHTKSIKKEYENMKKKLK